MVSFTSSTCAETTVGEERSGVATLGHAGARAPATRGRAPATRGRAPLVQR